MSAPRVAISNGKQTILAAPWECLGCHTMHYFFVLTILGHRCVECASKVARKEER